MKCFYHNDMDGKCSAAIVYMYYVKDEITRLTGNCEFISIDYKDDFPFEKIGIDEFVIIVDFSLQKPGEWEKLHEITKDIIWIDHHKSAIEKHTGITCDLPGVRDLDKAACELTWKYFYPSIIRPKAVRLIGDYDMWKFRYGELTRYFQLGIKGEDCYPGSKLMQDLLETDRDVDRIIEAGEAIYKYQRQVNENLIKSFAFLAEFEGYKAVACNQGMTNSQLFDSHPETYDVMMPFIFDGEQYTVSVYTKRIDIDCSELAKRYGGGGHKQAAGFQCKELPFKNIVKGKWF